MKIGRKVGLLVGGLLLVDVATLGASGGLLLRAQSNYDSFIQSSIDDVAAANNLKDAYQAQNSAWDQMVINSNNPSRVEKLYTDLATDANTVESLTAQLSNAGNPALRSAVLDFIDMHRLITSTQLSNVPKVMRGNYTTGTVLTSRQNSALRAAAAPLQAVNQATQAKLQTERDDERRFMTIFTVSAIALVLALSLLALILTRRIVEPIRRMIDGAIDAADRRLPEAVSTVRSAEGDVNAPALPRFEGQTRDELDQLAGALNRMQDSAVDMAVDVRRAELLHAETLVNLGRRNQSMLTRTLSYVAELERSEKDPETLAKLFRLDHLATRIRRNAESMLVLAGAQQARMHSRPVPVANLTRAALAEIEDYNRVTVKDLEPATFFGPAAADTAHLLAELMENATQFSPEESPVIVTGRTTQDGYTFTITDQGLGMAPSDLAAANAKLAGTGDLGAIEDTKVLGHHIVSRIASRRGITVLLTPGKARGLVATVEIPAAMLIRQPNASGPDAAQPAPASAADTEQRTPRETAKDTGATPAANLPAPDTGRSDAEAPTQVNPEKKDTQPAAEEDGAAREASGPQETTADEKEPATPPSAPADPQVELRPEVVEGTASTAAAVPASPDVSSRTEEGAPAEPVVRAETVTRPAPEAAPRRQESAPRRRVRGANLGDLGAEVSDQPAVPRDANAVRAALSGLQGGVRNARNELAVTRQGHFEDVEIDTTEPVPSATPAPTAVSKPASDADGAQIPQSAKVSEAVTAPIPVAAQTPAADGDAPTGQRRRVRGAQLPDLGEGMGQAAPASRDAGRVRSQMGGLQASVARARRDAARRLAHAKPSNNNEPSTDIQE